MMVATLYGQIFQFCRLERKRGWVIGEERARFQSGLRVVAGWWYGRSEKKEVEVVICLGLNLGFVKKG
ncbi:hypothetical protein L1987_37423 [Smallanthus sonchifolius]|uniref:Uncharacterized protein n=1 Tax=Smallanthus sonchifolius TaxID=185202 RepID=A0ACB9HFW0_9ASTR|nr:hypothetical protein L1987_37423 [Smallanthus sonchifolius]